MFQRKKKKEAQRRNGFPVGAAREHGRQEERALSLPGQKAELSATFSINSNLHCDRENYTLLGPRLANMFPDIGIEPVYIHQEVDVFVTLKGEDLLFVSICTALDLTSR